MLQTLFVDDFLFEQGYFEKRKFDRSIPAFSALLGDCKRLKQLAVRVPEPVGQDDDFTAILDCLKLSADLRSLCLFIYLGKMEIADDEGYDEFDECHHWIERRKVEAKVEVQELANKVFAASYANCPRLVALVIDARYPNEESGHGDRCQQYGFMRVLQKDWYGRPSAAAVAFELKAIKLHEPYSEIFDDHIGLRGGT